VVVRYQVGSKATSLRSDKVPTPTLCKIKPRVGAELRSFAPRLEKSRI
jgi:hypothetical protein